MCAQSSGRRPSYGRGRASCWHFPCPGRTRHSPFMARCCHHHPCPLPHNAPPPSKSSSRISRTSISLVSKPGHCRRFLPLPIRPDVCPTVSLTKRRTTDKIFLSTILTQGIRLHEDHSQPLPHDAVQ